MCLSEGVKLHASPENPFWHIISFEQQAFYYGLQSSCDSSGQNKGFFTVLENILQSLEGTCTSQDIPHSK